MYALPLHAGGTRHHGALTVYRHTSGRWDDTHQDNVETFATAATELLTLQQRGLDLTGAFSDARRDDSILLLAAGTPRGPRPDPTLPLIRWFQHATLPAVRTHLHAVATRHGPAHDRYRFVLAVHYSPRNHPRPRR
ncbi:hypothetical protein QLQ12_42160 [Actinoplanes sp. NEAU-A12]|uniref:GAF domain-containing protein n=1 Tax=Actinoplanes sandaracinus TaxID=3045177 RepID=A0ABT6WZM0_9ACTN|nr:hypothetical protein [Actinoplanes sandaracinus]MDI6105210.1 hypothetical protein [Actinoplanes sandaracinus]